MSDDKVVFLAFRNKETVGESIEALACKNCRNKTYVAIYDGDSNYPMLKCAACGQHIGRIGWAE